LTRRTLTRTGRVAAEYPHLREIYVFERGGRVETHGFEHVDRAVAAGRRMIVFSGRIANWEIGMLAGVHMESQLPKSIAPLTIH
jgi:lauroyl/myristoyl acyltransferase